MKLQSMTGFGSGEASDDELIVQAEVKSVNHRFKDLRFKIPNQLTSIELELKKNLNQKFQRGSFDIYISYKRSESKSRFDDIDYTKVDEFLKRIQERVEKHGLALSISPTEFLRSEFYHEHDEQRGEKLKSLALEAFQQALVSLEKSRGEEGEKLLQVMEGHLGAYQQHFSQIEQLAETFQAHVEERLRKRFAEYGKDIQVEEPRFLQEVVFYLEKLDVQEEINRIKAHLSKFEQLLKGRQEVGRQIDFLIQELNRETNTIGSKSALKDVSDAVVQMKVQLEKMREQGLNLE